MDPCWHSYKEHKKYTMFMHRITESDAENTGDAAAVWPLCVRTMSIHFSMHPFN